MRPSAASTWAAVPGEPAFSCRAALAWAAEAASGAWLAQLISASEMVKRGPGSMVTSGRGLSPSETSGLIW